MLLYIHTYIHKEYLYRSYYPNSKSLYALWSLNKKVFSCRLKVVNDSPGCLCCFYVDPLLSNGWKWCEWAILWQNWQCACSVSRDPVRVGGYRKGGGGGGREGKEERERKDHSLTCKLHRTCLYLVSIHQMAHLRLRLRTSNCSLLLIYLPRKDERLSWPGWLVT